MPLTITQKAVEVRLIFEVAGDDGSIYRDALVMSQAEHAALSKAEIEAMMQSRHAAWQAIAQPAPDERTEEDFLTEMIAKQEAELADQQALLTESKARLIEVEAKNKAESEAVAKDV